MGPTLVLSAPDGAHVGPMNFAIRDVVVAGVDKAPISTHCYLAADCMLLK